MGTSQSVNATAAPQRCSLDEILASRDYSATFAHIISGIFIGILYGFIQKRRNVCCGKYSRPSIAIPVDLIMSTPERPVYVLLFGSISGELLFAIVGNGLGFAKSANDTITASTSIIIAFMLLLSLAYFPAFASVRAPIPLLGYCIGLVYSCVIFGDSLQRLLRILISCFNLEAGSNNSFVIVSVFAAAMLPVSITQLLVLIWFLWSLVREGHRLAKCKTSKLEAMFERPEEHYSRDRVKWLLSKWEFDPGHKGTEDVQEALDKYLETAPKVKGKRREKFQKKCALYVIKFIKSIYQYDPYIHYPLRFLAALIIMTYILYALSLVFITFTFLSVVPLVDRVKGVSDQIEQIADSVEGVELGGVNVSTIIFFAYDNILFATTWMAVVVPIGPIFAFIACLIVILLIVRSVHIHLKKLSKGDYSFLPEALPSPTYRLVQSIQYVGYQIGFFTWGWILLVVCVWIVGFIVLIFYYLFKFLFSPTLRVILAIVIPLLYSFVIYYFQVIFSKLFFVGDTHNKHTVINNIRLFHWFSYIFLFQNTVVGIFSAFVRILYSILFGLLLLFRLDRVVLMRGFENFDKGFKSYIGFLYLEHTLNNPVLKVFTTLLLNTKKKKKKEICEVEFGDPKTDTDTSYPRCSQQAYNKWFIAYTLINNIELSEYRACHVALKMDLAKKWKRPKWIKEAARYNSMDENENSGNERLSGDQQESVPNSRQPSIQQTFLTTVVELEQEQVKDEAEASNCIETEQELAAVNLTPESVVEGIHNEKSGGSFEDNQKSDSSSKVLLALVPETTGKNELTLSGSQEEIQEHKM